MKRSILTHLLAVIVLLLLVSLTHNWIPNSLDKLFSLLPLWIGGLLGTFLPDLDRFIYDYFLKPPELAGQNVNQITPSRTNLVFHTVLFQSVFYILGFLVVSSSSSLLGKGMVLAIMLHLFLEQLMDLKNNGNINNWLKNLPLIFDSSQSKYYVVFAGLVILVFAFLF